jgi:TonB family protein
MISAPWQELKGRTIDGKFPLLQFLGGNPRSAVFLTQFGEGEPRAATIRLAPADSSDGDLLARWKRVAELSHPHLIRLLQTGSWQTDQARLHYAVMEYAEEDLATVLRDRPLTSQEARSVLESVLEILRYLHGQGLVHARLKPANILAVNDRLKISCDGIRLAGEMPPASESTTVYDAPETRNEGFSPAGDMWSLGVTMVEALTQRLPDQTETGWGVILPEALPAEFREIADSCLQTNPHWRPRAGELAARLHQGSDHSSQHVPEPLAVNLRGASRRWRYAIPAAVLGVVTMLVTIGVMNRRDDIPQAASSPAPPPVAQPRTESQPEPIRPPVTPARQVPSGSADRVAPPRSAEGIGAPPSKPKVKSDANGGVLRQVLPDVPAKARATIQGTVRIGVRTQVDASGRVTSAEIASAGPSSYFAGLALRASRQWEFEPMSDGSVWLLKFELTRGGTKVHPSRVSP